jgi:hypothetical protein
VMAIGAERRMLEWVEVNDTITLGANQSDGVPLSKS